MPPREQPAIVRRILAEKLTEVERNVLSWRMETSDKEIAKELGLTENNVRKIRSEALKKWVKAMESWAGPDER
jgi:DNA-directed RNA polymerase specialized sigma subunit